MPVVTPVEAGDPILLPDGDDDGDDADRRNARRPTYMDEIVLVADETD